MKKQITYSLVVVCIATLCSFTYLSSEKHSGNETTKQQTLNISEYDEVGSFHEGLATVKKDKKMGFINEDEELVIPLIYEYADYFSEGLAYVVKRNDQNSSSTFFIDKTNKIILTTTSYFDQARQFHEGLLAVLVDRSWGYINRSGKLVIKNKYSFSAGNFDNGYAIVCNYGWGGGKHGVIDNTGNEILPVIYDKINSGFKNDIFCVKHINQEPLYNGYGAIDKAGKIIIPFLYDDTRNLGNGLIAVMKKLKFGAVNFSNEIVIPIIYDYIHPFSEGLAQIEVDEKWGYIDSKGKIVISPKYDMTTDFKDGEAIVEFKNEYITINKKGEKVK